MRKISLAGLISLCLLISVSSGMPQLRNLSNYGQDCINTDKTYFILRETGQAEYGWASEWTHLTANTFPEKAAILIWHFKDESKAYLQVIEQLGDAGGSTGYLLAGKSAELKDMHGESVQPLSRGNYPVRLELYVGDFSESKGFVPDTLIDTACLDKQAIDYNQPYYFTQCEPEASKSR